MKEIGVLILINTLIVTAYLAVNGIVDNKKIGLICGAGMLIGLGLVVGDRLTKVKVPLIGEITAAAKADAEVT